MNMIILFSTALETMDNINLVNLYKSDGQKVVSCFNLQFGFEMRVSHRKFFYFY